MSSSSLHQAALERLVAQLDLLQSRLTIPVSTQPPHSPSRPFSAPPSCSLLPFSMKFPSEVDDVHALDKCLDSICERSFGARSTPQTQPHPPRSHPTRVKPATSRSSSPQPPRRPDLPRPKSTKSHSSTTSSGSASHPSSRIPKRPRTAFTPTNLRSARPPPIALRSIPAPVPPTDLRSARVDAPTSATSAKHATTSTPRSRPKSPSASHQVKSQSITLHLRVKPAHDNDPPDRHPSQSSHRAKNSNKRPRHRPDQRHIPPSEDERKTIQTSRKHRASAKSTTSHHHIRDAKDGTPSSESRLLTANREKKLRQEKHRNRQHQKRRDKRSVDTSHARPDSHEHTPSHHSSDSAPRSSARRRRKSHITTTDSDNEGRESGHSQIRPQSPREDSLKPKSTEHSQVSKLPVRSKSPPEPSTEAQPPPTTLQSLISFAHKSVSLSSTDGLDDASILKRRKSLATIPGCELFDHFSVFLYSRALCHHHKKALESMQMSYENQILSGKAFDVLSYDIDDDQWQKWIAEDKHTDKLCPPGLSKSLDAVQFMLRLLEETVDSEEEVAGKVMEEWYERGLTTELANWMLTTLKFWSQAKHHEGEHNENYSELVDWIIRLTCSIITYELSPSSLIYKVKNLQADKMFISRLRGVPPEESPFPFHRMLNSMLEFISGFPGSAGKECKISVSQVVQVYILRSGVPLSDNSPQKASWKAIHESNLDLPEGLCQSEFFWSCPFTKSLQQVRREPLAADSCFDVGFLVNVVSSPLFMRELLQNQSKCLELLCDVMTNTLHVLGREPLMSFRTIISEEKHFPSVPSVLDLVLTLMSSAVMQRELLTTDTKIKRLFLESLDILLMRSARMGSNARFQDNLEQLAGKRFLGRSEWDSILEKPLAPGVISEEKIMVKQRVLAFNAQVIASMGKSLEDGSRDMSQMNTLKAYLATKINNTRNRRRVWEAVLRIQGGLDRYYSDSGKKVEVLSPQDRNHFSMVVEAIRKHFQLESVDVQKTSSSMEDKSSSSNEVPVPRRRSGNVSLPPVAHMPQLCRIASQKQAYVDLDEDPQILRLAHAVITDKAQQTLARYDPNSDYAWKWVRLQRKNAYIGGARDLLEKNDRTLGQKCSCLPGNAKEKKDGSEIRVACSNDLCENRHLRIECVPGECGAGSYCQNQRLQRLEYAKFKMISFPNKGVGLVADEDIKAGALIGEYQGEVISRETFKQRMREYQGERHFYFMTLTNKLVIDASRKSQATRFLNHSCDPNAETQKWNAGGEPRVGIFAIRDIPKGEELTFDYGARSIEKGSAPCVCGSSKCRGTLTSKQEEVVAKSSTGNARAVEENENEPGPAIDPEMKDDPEFVMVEQDVMKRVQEKIAEAKNDLKKAEDLKEHADSTADRREPWNERKLTPRALSRLEVWKESSKASQHRKGYLESAGPRMTDRGDSSFRIPRRSVPVKSEDRDEAFRTSATSGKPFERSSDAQEIIGTQASNAGGWSRSSHRIPRRSSFVEDLRPQNAFSKPAGSNAGAVALGLRTTEKKGVPEQPLSRAALIGIEKGFQPSSTKYKKKPLKPKIKERVRTRKTGSDSDSMDEYSTASEAEPIMDEKPVSPSQLPDGKGARSDDEFVAESPLETVHVSRQEDHKAWERRQHASKVQDPGGYRREGQGHGAQQKSFRPDEVRSQAAQTFTSSRNPDGETGVMGHRALLHSQMNVDSNSRVHGHKAPRNHEAPPITGKDADDDRYARKSWADERLHRDQEPQVRGFRYSQEAFRGYSPRPGRDPGGPREHGHTRISRARASEGAYDVSTHRDERQGFNRDGAYGQNYLHESSRGRIRERRDARESRWSNAGEGLPRGRESIMRQPHRDGWNPRRSPQRPAHHEIKPHSALRDIPFRRSDAHWRKESGSRFSERDRLEETRGRHESQNIPKEPHPSQQREPIEGEPQREQPSRGVHHHPEPKSRENPRPTLRDPVEIDKAAKSTMKVTSKAEERTASRSHPQLRSESAKDDRGKSDAATVVKPAPVLDPKIGGSSQHTSRAPKPDAEGLPKPHPLPPLRSSTIPAITKQGQGKSDAPRQGKSGPQTKVTKVRTEQHSKSLPSQNLDHRGTEKDADTRPDSQVKVGPSFEVHEKDESKKQMGKNDASNYAHSQGDGRTRDSLKRTERDEDPDGTRGSHPPKRRRSGSDGRGVGKSGAGSGIKTNGGASTSEIGAARTGDSRLDEDQRGRERRKHYDVRDGAEDDGFRRRNSDMYRDDRKRFRHWSPGRTQKRRKKSNREGTRSALPGDKGKEQEVRRHPPNIPVVRGSTQQKDLRSIIKKSRTGD